MLKNSWFLLQNRWERPVDTSPRTYKTVSGAPWETGGSQGVVKEDPGGRPGEPGGAQGGPREAQGRTQGGQGPPPGGTGDIELTSGRHLRAQMAPWGRLKIKRYS